MKSKIKTLLVVSVFLIACTTSASTDNQKSLNQKMTELNGEALDALVTK